MLVLDRITRNLFIGLFSVPKIDLPNLLEIFSLVSLAPSRLDSDSNTSLRKWGSGSTGGYNEPPTLSGCFLKII
jgi:hypothetical protein